ncbi:MAG: hypothetical protein H0U86_14160 [Chloroflexi bacterium]|nr:hypothetical protein [Chloroflexota bacterium]
MDLSKLNSNERLAFWGAILSIVGTILTVVGFGGGAGGLWLTFILALAMIAILFLPTWSPQTSLPGSKGSLMLVVGGIAGIGALLGLLALLGVIGFLGNYPLYIIGLLVGIAGGLMMGWGGWLEFQSEGGKFQLGTAPAAPGTPPSATTDTRPTSTDTSAARPVDSPVDTAPRADEPRPVDTARPADAPRSADDSLGSSDREDRPNP